MYINFWYPVCTSEELTPDEPVRAEILGLRFVAFRDGEGNPAVLSDTCVHRGGSLGKGWVKDGCVVCPYHGWRYASDGKCTLVPSFEEGVKPPPRAKIDSYPVQEKYGIVFAFLGDLPEEERPPLYEIEEYDDPAWRASEVIILEVDCYYERSMENGVDPMHNEFVHPVQGNPKPIPGTTEYPDLDWGSGVTSHMHELGKKASEDIGMKSNPSELWSGTWHHGPNTLMTWITFGKGRSLHQYLFESPQNANHTRIFFINMRCFMLEEEHDEAVKEANLRVTTEDISILENLYPVRTPETRTKEILTTGDKAIVRYRDCLKDWEARGWRMDRKTMQANAGDVAYAIPCPARRTSGNWVLDEVPLMPGAAESSESVESAA